METIEIQNSQNVFSVNARAICNIYYLRDFASFVNKSDPIYT